MKNKDLKKRILQISYDNKLSHLGSCLTAVDIIDHIYSQRRKDDPFILSSGHAGLALYVVLEKYLGMDAEELFELHGVHPNRDMEHGIYCSGGSLGQGLPIAIGMALAQPEKRVYCLISDGESNEGSIWESLRIIQDKEINNIEVHINTNGFAAYDPVDQTKLMDRLFSFHYPKIWFTDPELPFLKGLDSHYHVMTEAEYNQAMGILK